MAKKRVQLEVKEVVREVLEEVGEELTIQYPKLEVLEYSTTSEHGPITPEDMEVMLGWETEEQYQKRMVVKYPNTKEEDHQYYDDFHCLNTKKEKVRCSNNANNRPFDMGWCEQLKHTILQGWWAGPLTFPGETVNGETIRISKYGRVLSGQHQGTALILANEELQKSRQTLYYDPEDPETEKYPFWRGHKNVVIESLVVLGLSEDERVLRTIDYVKQRTVADMLFTMELFRKNTPVQRKEMTRMLANAIDLLWTRTCAQGYRTHPEVVGFLERHMRLLDCVEHIFLENRIIVSDKKRLDNESDEDYKIRMIIQSQESGRRISKLGLSPGQCSAMMYLQGCSNTDDDISDNYRNDKPPTEKTLDWSMLDKAKQFFSCLSNHKSFLYVRKSLTELAKSEPDNEDNQGLGGRLNEQMAIISQAWNEFKELDLEEVTKEEFNSFESIFTKDDLEAPDGVLSLSYIDRDEKNNPLPNGKIRLLNVADFLGIDCPDEKVSKKNANAPPPTKVTPEEIEERKKLEQPKAQERAVKEKKKKSIRRK